MQQFQILDYLQEMSQEGIQNQYESGSPSYQALNYHCGGPLPIECNKQQPIVKES